MKKRKHRRILWPFCFFVVLVFMGTAAAQVVPDLFQAAERETAARISEQKSELPEVTVTAGETGEDFYYRQLTEQEQTVYREMLQGILGMEECIFLHAGKDMDTAKIYEYLLCDRPDIFWCTGDMRLSVYNSYTEMYPGYTCTTEEKKERQDQITAAAEACFQLISEEMSEYEKIKSVFEFLVGSVDYDSDAPDNQNIYSALVGKRSVCAGYSRAAQYLLKELDIECIYVTGSIKGQGAHAWNIVKCNGMFYHMDVTFGDPVFLGEESGVSVPDNVVNYDYLCCTDTEIMTDHEMDPEPAYPSCTADDLNYYRLSGVYYESYDKAELLEDMKEGIENGNPVFVCKFAGTDVYQSAVSGIVEHVMPEAAQYLASVYGMDRVKYTYSDDSVHNKFSVFWVYQ